MVDKNSISGIPLFSEINEQYLDVLTQLIHPIELKKGEVVFDEKNISQHLYIIKDGVIRLTGRIKGEERQTLAVLRASEFFGAIPFVDNKLPLGSAEVIKDAQLYVIRKVDFDRFLETNPQCGYIILRRLAKSVCSTLRQMDEEFIDMLKFLWGMGAKI